MIEHRISPNPITSLYPTQMIWQTKYLRLSLGEKLEQLYKSTSQVNRKLYNIPLYKHNVKSANDDALIKNKLDLKTKRYITWCYLAFNWQYVSVENLDTYLSCLPNSQSDPQEIRVEPGSLKISKHNKSLNIDLLTHDLQIENNNYCLDSFDRKGKYQYLPYYPSLCQLTVNNETYRFDGLIRLVESCQHFMAVATYYSIYIIGLKEGMGVSRFPIQQCIDAKWSPRGLYYLQKDGHLGLLERQTTFVRLKNQFSQHTSFSLNLKETEFVPQRIAVIGTSQTNHSLVLLAASHSNPKKLLLQMVNNPKYGMCTNSLIVELREVGGDILFKNLLVVKSQLILVVVNGKGGKVQDYHQYKFGTV